MSKLVNSLSWMPTLVAPQPIDPQKTLYRNQSLRLWLGLWGSGKISSAPIHSLWVIQSP